MVTSRRRPQAGAKLQRRHAYRHGPNSLSSETPNESPIFIYELCAAIHTVCVAIDWPRGVQRACVFCVDSQADVAALVKGNPHPNRHTASMHVLELCRPGNPPLLGRIRTRRIQYFQWSFDGLHFHAGGAVWPERGTAPSVFREVFEFWGVLRLEATAVKESGRYDRLCYFSLRGANFFLCMAIFRMANLMAISNHGSSTPAQPNIPPGRFRLLNSPAPTIPAQARADGHLRFVSLYRNARWSS